MYFPTNGMYFYLKWRGTHVNDNFKKTHTNNHKIKYILPILVTSMSDHVQNICVAYIWAMNNDYYICNIKLNIRLNPGQTKIMAQGRLPLENFHMSLEWINEWLIRFKIETNHGVYHMTWQFSFNNTIWNMLLGHIYEINKNTRQRVDIVAPFGDSRNVTNI